MTKCLYHDSDELKSAATVTGLINSDDQPPAIVLDQTVFHAQGGGQPSDKGSINGIPVLKVSFNDSDVIHQLESINGFKQGDSVELEVDPDIRLLHSRYHTAGHLIAGVVEAEFPKLEAKQGHHWPGEARVEFADAEVGDLQELLEKSQNLVDEAIQDDLPVKVENDGTRQIVISEYRPLGCGGTHVKSLKELGSVKLEQIKKKRGMLRIRYSVSEEL